MPTNIGRNIDSLLDQYNEYTSELEVQVQQQQQQRQQNDNSTEQTPEELYQIYKRQWFFHPSSYYMRDVDGYDGQGCNSTTGCIESCEFYPKQGRMEINADGSSSYTITYIHGEDINNNKTADKDNNRVIAPSADVSISSSTTKIDCSVSIEDEEGNRVNTAQEEEKEHQNKSSSTIISSIGPIAGVKLSTNIYGEISGERQYSSRFGPEDRLCLGCGRELNIHNLGNICINCRRLFFS